MLPMNDLVTIGPDDDSPVATVARNVLEAIDVCDCQTQTALDFAPGMTSAIVEHQAQCEWFSTAAFDEPVLIVVHRRQREGEAA